MSADQILFTFYPLTADLIETASEPTQACLRDEAIEMMESGKDDREIHMSLADALVEWEG